MANKKKDKMKNLKKGEIFRERVNSQQGYEDWQFTGKTLQGPLGVNYYAMENDRGVHWFSASEIDNMKHQTKTKKILGAKIMANDKKKKNQKKTTSKRTSKASTSKPKATKPTAKKSTPKSTAGKKQVKASTSKSKVQKSEHKKSATKKTTAKKKPQEKNTLKPDWNYEKDKPKTTRGKKEEIIINIPKKPTGQPKPTKSVTKQVTDQLPDNAKLRTIHLHFKID